MALFHRKTKKSRWQERAAFHFTHGRQKHVVSSEEAPVTSTASKWKQRMYLALSLLSLTGTFFILFFHPFFSFRSVVIDGNKKIATKDVEESINSILDYKRLFLFPGRNYFLANDSEIENILLSRFPFSNVKITKTFPKTLHITIEEEKPFAIYDNGKYYSYIDDKGIVIELLRKVGESEWKKTIRMVSSTTTDGTVENKEEILSQVHTPQSKIIEKEFGSMPLIYDKREKEIKVGDTTLPDSYLKIVADWQAFLNEKNIGLGYAVIQDELGTIQFITHEGWQISINAKENISSSKIAFENLIKDMPQPRSIQYIDLRYSGKIYWR